MASSRKLGVALMQFNRAFRRYADRATADLPSMPLTGVQGLVVRHLYLCGKCGQHMEVISARIDLADQQLTQALTEEELKMFWQILDKLEHAMERTTVQRKEGISND